MRIFALLIGPAIGTCPFEHSLIMGPNKKIVDVIVLSQNNKGGGLIHCSSIWPNDEPEAALFPVPPGCLYVNVDAAVAPQGAVAMQVSDDERIFWVPESEYASFQIAPFPTKCHRVFSRTNFENKSVIIGEGCIYSGSTKGCGKPKVLAKSEALCAEPNFVNPLSFGESSGWHRTLTSDHISAGIEAVGFQWIPREMFADPDELGRMKTKNAAFSISKNINIENASLISPPQVVQVNAFPWPLHARVNPPKLGSSHKEVKIPTTIWMTRSDSRCSVETLNLPQLLGIPSSLGLSFTQGYSLFRISPDDTPKYATTRIPSGNPEDLFLAVVTTATSAIAGAISIVVASLRRK